MTAAASLEAARSRLFALEHRTLELIATGADLAPALDSVCRGAEALAPGLAATILEIRDGRLYPLAGPSLPAAYGRSLTGMAIGPVAGSCGTAAWRGEPVEVRNIRRDPLWAPYLSLPLPDDLVACWSTPIRGHDRAILGTFAFYFREERGPTELETLIVESCVHICAIALENERSRQNLRRAAFEDPVTGLMSRAAFTAAAEAAVGAAAAAGDASVAVLLVDLDAFKEVNDNYGHRVGDLLLAAVGERLRAAAEPCDAVARLGGDEFAILRAKATHEDAADLALGILDRLAEPVAIEDHRIAVGASIGIALSGKDGRGLEDLLKSADLALYRAKGDGRGRHCFFTRGLADEARRRRAMAVAIRRALDLDAFTMLYQPIVSLATRAVVGCEALMRWQDQTLGNVPPSTFIPIAEDRGLIAELGQWSLGEACRQLRRWPAHLTVSVNISPLQLRVPAFVDDTIAAVRQAGVDPHRIVLEITESAVLGEATRDVLLALKRAGFNIALDDFGTGYSSLRSLRIVPIDKLKIDRSFIADFGENAASTSIVRAVISMARSLDLTTTAEGVESGERAAQLAAEGCREAQGFHFGQPMDADGVAAMLTLEAAPAAERLAAAG